MGIHRGRLSEDTDEDRVITFDRVGLRYGVGPEVLKDVSFHIEPGSFFFLTGPSGAGKSSLLRLMYLAQRPSRGTINVFGNDSVLLSRTDLPDIRRRIGIVFQEFRLLDHLTTFENIALPFRAQGRNPEDYHADVIELMEWVGLGDKMSALPAVLSGGEKQRAAIARAVIAQPDLLLADEPTGNVDPQLARRLLRLFMELNRLGTSVVLATHDFALMDQFKAPRMVLDDGHLEIERGPAQ